MGVATLGGKPFHIDPSSVFWPFKMKVAERRTVGGRVVQILGTTLGDMTVSGSFFPLRSQGQTAAWEAERDFIAQVLQWSKDAAGDRFATPIRFTYSPRSWDFNVLVKNIGQADMTNENFAPKYNLTLFIVEDRTGVVVKGIKDLYIQRLFNGIGWKQTKYNGPTQAEVDKVLGGQSIGNYLANQFAQAANNPSLPVGGSG